MKEYVSERWQKRWPIVPASLIAGIFWVARSLTVHDGKAVRIVIFVVCFDVFGILFPFRWGGEQ